MLQLIKEEFIVSLRHNKWMDDVTRQKAMVKVSFRLISQITSKVEDFASF